MLQGKLGLHDIRDVELFAGRIVERSGLTLNEQETEELVTYLIEECWILSLRYHSGGISFSTFAGTTLRRRVSDWRRSDNKRTKWQFHNRTYERVLPEFVSLEHRPDAAQPASEDDIAGSGLRDLLGLHGTGDSREAGVASANGEGKACRAA